MIQTTVLGYPRIGEKRELKWALEKYWKGNITFDVLNQTARQLRKQNWTFLDSQGLSSVPSNDFSYYDQVLDMCLMTGCIPPRFEALKQQKTNPYDVYFAMARGIQSKTQDIKAMEMTKWFDTNYHYIVPEFEKKQTFHFFDKKIIREYKEALAMGIQTRPVLLSPITFLLLGKESQAGFNRIDLIDRLLPVYYDILDELVGLGVDFIQMDEPFLSTNLDSKTLDILKDTYQKIVSRFPKLRIFLASYFDCYGENLDVALSLPIDTLHMDLVSCSAQIEDVLNRIEINSNISLSLGIVDGRNIWMNHFEKSLAYIERIKKKIGPNRLWVASSCSLLHCPYDLDLETDEEKMPLELKQWMAFSKQKVQEIIAIKSIVLGHGKSLKEKNTKANQSRSVSPLIHHSDTKNRVKLVDSNNDFIHRQSPFNARKLTQQESLNLPLLPTTTIGSFPQTSIIRKKRQAFRKGQISLQEYTRFIRQEIKQLIDFQEQVGLDVLVHGEFERNDMVEYFGEQLHGFTSSDFGWVQSYGSRCVKPPIIYGDVYRKHPMTLDWIRYAQSLTQKPVKAMLTGPATILQWSFVRDDQPLSKTCYQIALAVRDEVSDLERGGLKIIQIDEPAIREGLPLREENWAHYFNWAIRSFRLASTGVKDTTQIHTHMCYSAFNHIIEHISDMDADVITIENARSGMELLDTFIRYTYSNDIGPGIYDIHSPRVPTKDEMEEILQKTIEVLSPYQIWVNPDCGLKTRDWEETKQALTYMVDATRQVRKTIKEKNKA